jgi:hypothetical protein
MVTNASIIVTVDLIHVTTATAGPIVTMTTGIDMKTTAMIDAMTIVATTATIGMKTARVIAVMTSTVTAEITGVMTDVASTMCKPQIGHATFLTGP